MFKPAAINAVSLILALQVYAQTPAPSAPPTAAGSAATAKSPAPSTSALPTTDQMIDSLGEADLQSALSLLKSNFTNPDAITESELNRATLTGLLVRMPGGLMLLPNRENTPAASATPIYSEIFENHIGYLRLGDLSAANLKELDKKLQEFSQKKVDAVVVDLRASNTGDFAAAAEVAKRFCPKGKALFSVRKAASKQDRQFTSDREPAFQGLIVVLADADTAGSAEALAATLKLNNKALIIGQSTSGRAVEYSDQPLPSGKILRVASAEAVLPDGQPLFPGGVKPDLPVEMPLADKRQIFRQSAEKGMGPFVYDGDRPHLNEAALIAGTNPELDISDAQRRLRPRSGLPMRDPVLQRALDVVTSLEIYQKR
ncbi:MAG TPA: S41 family peptidase [Chthoniobacterales bacterium]|nr:S41 family peptidase [Chthoniobacterales bacterium]